MNHQEATPDLDDMTPKQVREWVNKAGHAAAQFGEIRATLIVNCQEGRVLHKLGITYDETKPVVTNLVYILGQLCHKAEEVLT